MKITLSNGKVLPIEMHKVKIEQKTSLPMRHRFGWQTGRLRRRFVAKTKPARPGDK